MSKRVHPHPRSQRAKGAGDVPKTVRKLGFEPQDASPRGVAFSIAGLFSMVIVSGIVIALVLPHIAPRQAAPPPQVAAANFRSPAPPLNDGKVPDKAKVVHLSAEAQATIDKAMATVAAQGWWQGNAAVNRVAAVPKR